MTDLAGFVPPPYPYDRLDGWRPLAAAVRRRRRRPVDRHAVRSAAAGRDRCAEHAPTASAATRRASARRALRGAIRGWIDRRFDVDVPAGQVAACVGTKEFVATTPQFLHLRTPSRDTVLFPAVAYPTYEMGAILAGCRPVPVPHLPGGGIDLAAIDPDDAGRALMLWVNSPSNPTGALSDLAAAAAWGRARDVPVFSDECYVEFTWDGPAHEHPAIGPRRRGRRALAVEALQPRRRARRLLRR